MQAHSQHIAQSLTAKVVIFGFEILPTVSYSFKIATHMIPYHSNREKCLILSSLNYLGGSNWFITFNRSNLCLSLWFFFFWKNHYPQQKYTKNFQNVNDFNLSNLESNIQLPRTDLTLKNFWKLLTFNSFPRANLIFLPHVIVSFL